MLKYRSQRKWWNCTTGSHKSQVETESTKKFLVLSHNHVTVHCNSNTEHLETLVGNMAVDRTNPAFLDVLVHICRVMCCSVKTSTGSLKCNIYCYMVRIITSNLYAVCCLLHSCCVGVPAVLYACAHLL